MVVTNRWSKKKYEVWEISEKTVKLKREDGTIFEISKSEYQFNRPSKYKISERFNLPAS